MMHRPVLNKIAAEHGLPRLTGTETVPDYFGYVVDLALIGLKLLDPEVVRKQLGTKDSRRGAPIGEPSKYGSFLYRDLERIHPCYSRSAKEGAQYYEEKRRREYFNEEYRKAMHGFHVA